MNKKVIILFSLLLMGCIWGAIAQTDPVEGYWMDKSRRGKIQIYKSNGKFYGKIAWSKDADEGKPRYDKYNKNASLRNKPVLGMVILKNFVKKGKEYTDGTVYDPTSGKTYNAYMAVDGNKLALRGYLGIALLGKTEVFTRTTK